MIDAHHHLIYGVDDGPRTREDSMAMLQAAASQGVTEIICTSHICPGRPSLDVAAYRLRLRQLIPEALLLGIKLHEGAEILYSADTPAALAAGLVPTLGGTRHVLVEFYPDVPVQLLQKSLLDLRAGGWQPVLAHCERYACLRTEGGLARLKQETGVLLQMNADTVLESRGWLRGRWTRAQLHEGLIDLIASDAHHVKYRPCRMAEARKLLVKYEGEAAARRLFEENARLLLE